MQKSGTIAISGHELFFYASCSCYGSEPVCYAVRAFTTSNLTLSEYMHATEHSKLNMIFIYFTLQIRTQQIFLILLSYLYLALPGFAGPVLISISWTVSATDM